jgi:hypothetical protein
VGGLLIDFVHVENLYRIRNCRGRRLEEVGEMLVESNPMLDAPSFEREREVRKHIGDYTLFLTGMFPEYVATLPRRGLPHATTVNVTNLRIKWTSQPAVDDALC